MSALNLLHATPKFSTCTMFVIFTYQLLLVLEILQGPGMAGKVGMSCTMILLECCTINISVADISWKVISLQLRGYT
jgi:hypothetical protein